MYEDRHTFWISIEDDLRRGSDLSDLAKAVLEENKEVIVDELPTEPTLSRTIVHSIELIPGQVPSAKYPYRMSASIRGKLRNRSRSY